MIQNMRPVRGIAIMLGFALSALLAASPAPAADKVGQAHFDGLVVHVSTENIKVQNPQTKEALSFLLVPKFDQAFSSDGKTTYQMKNLKPGQYVKVYYDQKALGARHADRILVLNNANQKMGQQ
jgi:hypothetical protein